jgi:hypothetical protein
MCLRRWTVIRELEGPETGKTVGSGQNPEISDQRSYDLWG